MISMGSKSESKHIMEAAGVPVVPGYHGENQDPNYLKEQANIIGYPVLIKAIKGGGGKGMRIVQQESEFLAMLESSKSEGRKSFGDDQVLVEKYLARPRHVEVQVFADKLGNVVHLFERDCSVQRRHQKILEEAPAPNLSVEVRADLGAKAVAAAKAVGYVGAGTVEFILDTDTNQFYFMEMNTRLQVEHPVTEMVTNVDLVQWQLEVAAGNPLPIVNQQDIRLTGHAFEARIYAENPRKGFLPDVGPLTFLATPEPSANIRVETGVIMGDQVSVHYDPMIAKLVCRGRDRSEALRMLRTALQQYNIAGLSTNLDFLKTVTNHPAFINAEVETGFIAKYEKDLFPDLPAKTPPEYFIMASLKLLQPSLLTNNSTDPWEINDSFKNNLPSTAHFEFSDKDNKLVQVQLKHQLNATMKFEVTYQDQTKVTFDDVVFDSQNSAPHTILCEINGHRQTTPIILLPPSTRHPGQHQLQLFTPQGSLILTTPPPAYLAKAQGSNDSQHSVRAPMPCKITHVHVRTGDDVEIGQPLLVLEAMKMEHVIKSPIKGKITRVVYPEVGMLVPDNAELVLF